MEFKTEYPFTLPRGYLDPQGRLHREGVMRLAIARDEIEAGLDPRVVANEAYLPVVLLSRVLVRLGELSPISPQVIETLFSADMAFLEDLYLRINSPDSVVVEAACPTCGSRFHLQVAPLD